MYDLQVRCGYDVDAFSVGFAAPSFVWRRTPTCFIHLPAVYCRSCGRRGWATVNQVGSDRRRRWPVSGLDSTEQPSALSSCVPESFDGTSGGRSHRRLCWLDPNRLDHSGFVTDEAVRRSVLIHRPGGKDAANQTCPTCRPTTPSALCHNVALRSAVQVFHFQPHLPEKEKGDPLSYCDSVQDAAPSS